MPRVTRTFDEADEAAWVADMGAAPDGLVAPICSSYCPARMVIDGDEWACPSCGARRTIGQLHVFHSMDAESEAAWVERQRAAEESGKPSQEQFGASSRVYDRAMGLASGDEPAQQARVVRLGDDSAERRAELRKRAREAIGDAKRCAHCGLPISAGRGVAAIEAALRWKEGERSAADYCSAACALRAP